VLLWFHGTIFSAWIVLFVAESASFLSILWFDMIIFGACMALAIYFRKRPEYHRRLVFMAS
jgi:hypothetical protein